MAYDKERPIPWKSLLRLTGLDLMVANVAFAVMSKEEYGAPTIATTLAFGALYLAFSVVLAKFGLDPVSMRPRRTVAAAARRLAASSSDAGSAAPSRGRRSRRTAVVPTGPAATRRTNATNPQVRKPARKR